MKGFMFNLDGKNFCQFMNQNVPKPMFLGLDSVGALIFSSKHIILYVPTRATIVSSIGP